MARKRLRLMGVENSTGGRGGGGGGGGRGVRSFGNAGNVLSTLTSSTADKKNPAEVVKLCFIALQ